MQGYLKEVKRPFISPITPGTTVIVPRVRDVCILRDGNPSGGTSYDFEAATIEISTPTGTSYIQGANTGGQFVAAIPATYLVRYFGTTRLYQSSGGFSDEDFSYTFYIQAVENQLPLKKWTITDVINRTLDLCEPHRSNEKPRFRLQGVNADGTYAAGSQAAMFDTVLSPEFSFTKQTLRECLQEIGKVIHGEPRAAAVKDSSGNSYYEISYDLYGQGERWKHAHRAYSIREAGLAVANYATELDTHAENLINKQANYDGVIVEPFSGGSISTRTEELFVQITEENMLIPTRFPIYSVEALYWVRVTTDTNNNKVLQKVNITPWLFEQSVYTAQLSSYSSQYPNSKAYGLMYTQGEKNITQLNFKQENPISTAFSNYAILNVLRSAINDSSLTIAQATAQGTDGAKGQYPELCFQIVYTPFYQGRVGQTKLDYKEYKRPASLIYNQQANVIESRAYGENLKGAIARIGNVEKSLTYRLGRLEQVPQAGMAFDDDYTISGVWVEILATCINMTIALTKNFNRISQYVGISSMRRFSQISQTMAVERNTLWQEYVVVGDQIQGDSDTLMTITFGYALRRAFIPSSTTFGAQVTTVTAWGITGEGNALPTVSLPVIASSFGNSISFSWEYEDNYSAGRVASWQTNGAGGSEVSGYFQDALRYTDYYGGLYYYQFELYSEGTYGEAGGTNPQPKPITPDNYLSSALSLPNQAITPTSYSGTISTLKGGSITLRKDSREKLQCNYQVNFVTNRKGFIIGSGLAANCAAVRTPQTTTAAKLYIFDEPLNKFIDTAGGVGIDLSTLPSQSIYFGTSISSNALFTIQSAAFSAGGKAWAIITEQTSETESVETQTGEVTQQTILKGGEVLIAQNMEFSAGEAFPVVYFTPKREVFNKSVWKDKI